MRMTLDWLAPAESARLFSAENEHPAVPLQPLPAARLLWLNRRVMRQDPAWAACGGREADYARQLLHQCALVTVDGVAGAMPVQGQADRYGGWGIGHNGGSGRAVVVGGYHVKGVGRTPLVGHDTDAAHASGGAYLEECVRETILAEITAAEFPHGAVPTLAIIDTGAVQVWQTTTGPKTERRCLLVRPSFLRPAHLERAEGFRSLDPREGLRDRRRVRAMFATATGLWGREALLDAYGRFWQRWAEQLAYGYVHRMPHGAHTTSNVCLDGRLLDFGAMAALPSWACIDTMPGNDPAGAELALVMRCLATQLPQWARDLDTALGHPDTLGRLLHATRQAYAHTLRVEMLRVLGLSRRTAVQALASDLGVAISHELRNVVRHSQRERFAIFGGTPEAPSGWDVARFWDAAPPLHLTALRGLAERVLNDPGVAGTRPAVALKVARGCLEMRTLNRRGLYRETAKQVIYESLERGLPAGAELAEAVEQHIREQVSAGRRDGVAEPQGQRPLGYAVGSGASCALHEDIETGQVWARWEGQDHAAAMEVAAIDAGEVRFADSRHAEFHAAVSLRPMA